MARPRIELDEDLIYQMAKEGCSVDDIATEFACSDQTIYNKYYEVWKAGQAAGRRALHRRQFEKAMDGDSGMLRWLGANRLGQSDKVHQTNGVQEIEVVIRKPLKAYNGEIGDSRPATSPDRLLEQSGEA
jgi:hypothetical protein